VSPRFRPVRRTRGGSSACRSSSSPHGRRPRGIPGVIGARWLVPRRPGRSRRHRRPAPRREGPFARTRRVWLPSSPRHRPGEPSSRPARDRPAETLRPRWRVVRLGAIDSASAWPWPAAGRARREAEGPRPTRPRCGRRNSPRERTAAASASARARQPPRPTPGNAATHERPTVARAPAPAAPPRAVWPAGPPTGGRHRSPPERPEPEPRDACSPDGAESTPAHRSAGSGVARRGDPPGSPRRGRVEGVSIPPEPWTRAPPPRRAGACAGSWRRWAARADRPGSPGRSRIRPLSIASLRSIVSFQYLLPADSRSLALKKSSETFSRLENLRFSRAFRARHVIHEVQQAVCPQPAKAFRRNPGRREVETLSRLPTRHAGTQSHESAGTGAVARAGLLPTGRPD
jgi:hypothetical protein